MVIFYRVLWEDILRDTLLNFAGTPKGLSLLEQNKALMDCVYYMYSRQAQRLQVSYGVSSARLKNLIVPFHQL